MISNDENRPAKMIPQTNWHHHYEGYDTSKWRRQNFFDLTNWHPFTYLLAVTNS